jgi:hypothetical protein
MGVIYTVMEFPKPTIDVDSAARAVILGTGEIGARAGRDGSWPARDALESLLAQAWEEGRWSPPGATQNPYGEPASPRDPQLPGAPLMQLRAAALVERPPAALADRVPSCGRYGYCRLLAAHRGPCLGYLQLEEQLRDALGDQRPAPLTPEAGRGGGA